MVGAMRSSDGKAAKDRVARKPNGRQLAILVTVPLCICLIGVLLFRQLGLKGEVVIPVAGMMVVPEILRAAGGRPEHPVYVYRSAGIGGILAIVVINLL